MSEEYPLFYKKGWLDGWLEDHPDKTLADAEKAFLTQQQTKEVH